MDNLEEMDKFLENYILPKWNQEKIDDMNRLITGTEIEAVIFKNIYFNRQKPRARWPHRWMLPKV